MLATFGRGGVMVKLGLKALMVGATSGAVWSLLAAGLACAADLKLKAPPVRALPPAPAADAIPMFGDFQDLDSDTNVRRGAFKIQENESPRPMDRVYFNYNFYSGVDLGSKKVDIQRETFGFEKTVLDGNASLGIRVPIFQNLDSKDDIGDITLIGKYAFFNDRTTGNVISGGVAVTPPTGNFSMDGFRFHQEPEYSLHDGATVRGRAVDDLQRCVRARIFLAGDTHG
jgi:hypothetical protein